MIATRAVPSLPARGGWRAKRPGGEKSPFLAGFSPPPRFARTLPSRGGMALPMPQVIQTKTITP